MKANYPDARVTTAALYDTEIGASFHRLYEKPAFQNSCAVRMSYALIRSGVKLALAPRGGSYQGRDKSNYWFRVLDLRAELVRRFKNADAEVTLTLVPKRDHDNVTLRSLIEARKQMAQAFIEKELKGRNGIVVFEVTGWGDANGHFTLWDGSKNEMVYAPGYDKRSTDLYYFWLTDYQNMFGAIFITQVKKIRFWELIR